MYKLNEKVIFEKNETDGKYFFLIIDTGEIYELNDEAAVLIQNLLDVGSLESYTEKIIQKYNNLVSEEQIVSDANQYIDSLIEMNILIKENLD